MAALAAAIAFLQLLPALSWYWPAASARGPANCRLLLANVLTTNPSKEALLRLVEETDPDVILLQETDGRWLEALKTLEARYPLHSAVPRSDNFGIALYSRLPGSLDGVLFQQEHHLPALAATIKVNDRAVSILNLHTLPPVTGPMAFRRDAQLRSGRAWLESRPGPAILAGDLNLTHYSPIYRRLVRGLNARNARAGFGPIGTWPRWLPIAKLPLDHCLVRGDIDVVNCRVGSDIGSDHLPVIVDLHIPAHESSRHF